MVAGPDFQAYCTPGNLIPERGALSLHKTVQREPLVAGAVHLVHAVLPGVPPTLLQEPEYAMPTSLTVQGQL